MVSASTIPSEEMTLSQILDDIHTGDGLLNDSNAAARSRANQTRMRQNETPAYREGRSEPLLPPIKAKTIITQEVIKDMANKVNADDFLESAKAEIIADYMNPSITLRTMLLKYHLSSERWSGLRVKWNVPSKGKNRHPRKKVLKTLENMPKNMPTQIQKAVLPTWTEMKNETDEVKIKWLELVSNK
jgi:hypothetical protein